MTTGAERVANTPDMVARFAAVFHRHPTPALIANLTTRVDQIEVAGRAYPLTFNDRGQAGNCYICNPVTAYIDYALEETRNFSANPALKSAVRGLIRACAPLVRASGIDHQVQINNWLFSTNPMPDLNLAAASALRDRLTTACPDRALVLRSLNDMADAASLAALRAAGFRLLPARQIYLHAADAGLRPPSNDMKRDLALIARSNLQVVGNDGFTMADYDRSAMLYAMLYIHKYTPLNPAYTALYLGQMHRAGLIGLRGLRAPATGQLVAVTGLFENGRTLTQPIVGYDTTLPVKAGLYRMAMAIAQDHARRHGLFFNMSAGAAAFKRLRQALPAIEYTAVFADHLPRRQRIALRVMEEVLTRTGIPLLRKYEL